MGGPRLAAVRDYLLFTVVGVAIEAQETVIFALGDGLAAVNGEVLQLSFVDNKPPYLGYGLIPQALSDPALGRQGFSLLARCATADLNNLLLATDGLGDLSGEDLEAVLARRPGVQESASDPAPARAPEPRTQEMSAASGRCHRHCHQAPTVT